MISLSALAQNVTSVRRGPTLISESVPCPIDTLKGILIWHSGEHYNDGNAWDYGYWIGKCGPKEFFTKDIIFVPGIIHITQGSKWEGEKDYTYSDFDHYNEGFRDAHFKKIPANKVYGLIILHK